MDKPIWESSTAEQKVILITLLMMANHKEKEWEFNGEKYKAEPGQFVTSLEAIRKKSGKDVSIKNVRTALVRFEKLNFLASQSTNRNRLITIVNWGFYQQKDDEVASQPASNRQATGKQPATNKNVRKKEVNKKIRPKVAPSDTDLENAHLLYEKILTNLPNYKKPNFVTWGNAFRLLREQDKVTNDKEIKFLITFSQEHKFWKKNILSAVSFRDKYNTLYLEAKDAGDKRRASEQKTGGNRLQTLDEIIENLEKEQGAIE
jgi:hypothetical protein